MIYPASFESKIGFDFVRQRLHELCHTTIGQELTAAMTFETDYHNIKVKLECVAEMATLNSAGTPVPLAEVSDVPVLLKQLRLAGAILPAADMLKIGRLLDDFAEIRDFFNALAPTDDAPPVCPRLIDVVNDLHDFPECRKAVSDVIDRFGAVRDNASPELADIRRQLLSSTGSVNAAMRRVIAKAVSAGVIDADVTPTLRDGRLVLPVSPMHKRRLPGIVQDESATGKTVFIEPAEVVSANNHIRELQLEERREIARILLALAERLRPHISEIEESLTVVGHLDYINAKALLAEESGGMMPNLHDSPELEWYHAVHPELLHSLAKQGKEPVALDISLNKESGRILVISGPNAGGKSVCLKTVGTLQYMVQCGILPPVYENSHFGVFRDIFVDIGDDQSLDDDLSTYSSHLKNMRVILQKGDDRSLLLIDEFGGGTEPQIGGALAQAILTQINDKGMWGVVTTHYQNLKQFAEDTQGLVNGSMLYDRHVMKPLFKLSIGNPGSSFALEIARRMGLPAEVIADAERIVGSDYVNLDKYLLDIARDKKYWENKRQAIRQKEKKVDAVLERYEEEAAKLRAHRSEILASAREEARQIIQGSNSAVERTIAEIRHAQAERERTLDARKKLKEQQSKLLKSDDGEPALLKKAPRKKRTTTPERSQSPDSISVGSVVKLDGEGVPGRVEAIDGKKATVVFGMLKTSVEIKRLKPTDAKLPAVSAKSSFISSETADAQRSRQLNFSREIDVRGMRVDEALQAVTYFIDDAVRFSADRVRILHGTGTGALRQAIRSYLATVQSVRAFRDEHVQFGGAGITVVDLR